MVIMQGAFMQSSLLIKLLFFTLFFIKIHAEVAHNEQILTANGGDGVSISGEWAFVGDQDNCLVNIYKLNYSTMEWGDGTTPDTKYQTLGNNCNAAGFRRFGASVSNSGNWLAVGAPQGTNKKATGAFHLYEYNTVTGDWEARTGNKGYQGEDIGAVIDGQFGASVSLRGVDDTSLLLMVGAPTDGTNGAGKAYVFTLTNGAVIPINDFTGENLGDNFGLSVTSDGTRFLIGAPQHDTATLIDAGKVYLYSTINSTTADETYVGIQAGVERGKELSLSSTDYMLLSGNIATVYDGNQTLPTIPIKDVFNTNGGDVSQSVGVVAVAKKDTEVLIYPDVEDSNIPELSVAKSLLNFGEDINLYKEQLVVNGDINNEAYVYDFPCGIKPGKLNAYEWAIVSVPCGDSKATIGEIFGDDLGIYGDNDNWVMYGQNGTEWSGTSASMRQLLESDSMELGKGYWIITDANKTWKVDNTAVTTRTQLDTTTITSPPTTVGGYYFVGLPVIVSGETKKLMYGNPFPRSFKWKDLRVGRSGVYGPIYTSIVYNPTGYVYDTSSQEGQPYRAITATGTPGISDQIAPYEGFWIQETDENYDYTGYELGIPFEK